MWAVKKQRKYHHCGLMGFDSRFADNPCPHIHKSQTKKIIDITCAAPTVHYVLRTYFFYAIDHIFQPVRLNGRYNPEGKQLITTSYARGPPRKKTCQRCHIPCKLFHSQTAIYASRLSVQRNASSPLFSFSIFYFLKKKKSRIQIPHVTNNIRPSQN